MLRQVGANHIDAHRYALVAVQLQKEFPVVLDNFLEVLYAGGDPGSEQLAQSYRGMLQPMFESPHIPFHLIPVSSPTERTRRSRTARGLWWFLRSTNHFRVERQPRPSGRRDEAGIIPANLLIDASLQE
jgi:hypothetical protein